MFQMRQEEVEAHVDDIFSRLDTNRDGVVTIEEFVEACQRVSSTQRNMLEEMHPFFFLGLHHFYIVAEFRLKTVIYSIKKPPLLNQPRKVLKINLQEFLESRALKAHLL